MGKCIVLCCSNREDRKKSSNLGFYRVSRERYIPWMKAMGKNPDQIQFPIYSKRICSEHFAPNSFIYNGKDRILKKDALPTLKLKLPSRNQGLGNTDSCQVPSEEVQAGPSTQEDYADMPIGSGSPKKYTGKTYLKKDSVRKLLLPNVVTQPTRHEETDDNKLYIPVNTADSLDSNGTKESSEGNIEFIKVIHAYSMNPDQLHEQLQEEKRKNQLLHSKNRAEREKNQRLLSKVKQLEGLVKDLKNYLDSSNLDAGTEESLLASRCADSSKGKNPLESLNFDAGTEEPLKSQSADSRKGKIAWQTLKIKDFAVDKW